MALSLLAYNLGNLWRRLTLPQRIENWSLTSLQQRIPLPAELREFFGAVLRKGVWRDYNVITEYPSNED